MNTFKALALLASLWLVPGVIWSQSSSKIYETCDYDSLLTALRAYEDSFALARSTAVVRVDYAWVVTDQQVQDRVYRIYRCQALRDTLEVYRDRLDELRGPGVAFTCGGPYSFDGYSYSTVLIGTQCWFAENLRSDNYRNGDPIQGSLTNSHWQYVNLYPAPPGAQAIYNGDANSLSTYGRLYNWYSTQDSRGLCPTGWHVPTDAEFTALENFLGPTVAGAAMKSAPGDSPAWNGTNASGFTGLPGGLRYSYGAFSGEGVDGNWWTASPALDGPDFAYYRYLQPGNSILSRQYNYLRAGMSIRCLQDPPSAPTVDSLNTTAVTDTSVTLDAYFWNGWSDATATGFKLGRNAGLSNSTDFAGDGLSSPFSGVIDGLDPSTQYWVVAYVTNALGTTYGDTITFTTSAPSAPFDCSISSVRFDGYDYATVQIGSQCWFKENLRSDIYLNGDPIPGGMVANTWRYTTSGAQAIYNADSTANFNTYGRLYNWFAVDDNRGLCPTGWHVPSHDDWIALATTLGGQGVAGVAMKAVPPAYNGTNTSGFTALPAGNRDLFGNYNEKGNFAFWWSTTPNNDGPPAAYAWNVVRGLSGGTPQLFFGIPELPTGYSIRCLKDPVAPTVDTDAATSVGETSATLHATFTDGGSAVTATGFKYGTDAALTSPTDVAGNGMTSPFSAALTGLTASTQYWAVGYATNSVGTSFGDTITFTTSAAAPSCSVPSVTYDGFTYNTVLIGSQCWFKENLRNDNYADGTPIPGGLDNATWSALTTGAFSVYDEGGTNEAANLATYGRLYNGYAATNAAGLCPSGWHVPTDAEWTTLETQLGGASLAGPKLKATTPAWDGTNSSGFTGLPAGFRGTTGNFSNLGSGSGFWSSSTSGGNGINRWVPSGNIPVNRTFANPLGGASVRCVQDPSAAPTVDTEAATSVGETSATLHATFTDGGAAVTATAFKYGTDLNGMSDLTEIAGDGLTSPFTATLTGLAPNTTYWVAGYATNSVGTGIGDTIQFTTSAAASFTCGTSSVTYDGHSYSTVQIGTQCWFAENLRSDNYADGSEIPGGLDNNSWINTTSGAQAIYAADSLTNFATLGRLYNYYAVTDGRGLCPTGWHVPSQGDVSLLETYLSGQSVNPGDALKSSSTDVPAWDGTNSTGFNGLPHGFRALNGNTYSKDISGGYWTTTPDSSTEARMFYLNTGDQYMNGAPYVFIYGFAVRCLEDAPEPN